MLPWVSGALLLWATVSQIAPNLFQIPLTWGYLAEVLWGQKTIWVGLGLAGVCLTFYLWNIDRRVGRLESGEEQRERVFQRWLGHKSDEIRHEWGIQLNTLATDTRNEVQTQHDVLNRFHAEYDGRLHKVEETLRAKTPGELGLQLVYDPMKYPDCLAETADGVRRFRFALINSSDRTVEGVKVYLESVDPDALGFGNMEFIFMHDRSPWPMSLNGAAINPGPKPTRFVDVAVLLPNLELPPGTPRSPQYSYLRLPLVQDDVNRNLPPPPTQYTFVIKVEAPNTIGISRTFKIDPSRGIIFPT